MQCEDAQIVMHAAGIRKGKEPAKKPEIRQKIRQSPAGPDVFFRDQTAEGQQVHRHTAELKGKVPPVIYASIADI